MLGKGKDNQAVLVGLETRIEEKRKAIAAIEKEKPEENLVHLTSDIQAVFDKAQVASLSVLSRKIEEAKALVVTISEKEKEKTKAEEGILALEQALPKDAPPEEIPRVAYEGPALGQLDKTRDALLEKQIALQNELAQKKAKAENGFAGTRTVSQIESAMEKARQELFDLNETYDAIILAKETSLSCSEDLKQNFAPALNEKVGALIKKLTGGRYHQVRITDDYQMALRTGQRTDIIPAEFVSSGTYELIYFALRMAVLETLFCPIPFLCMDDSFLQLDKERQRAAFSMLTEAQADQILYFSCHEPTETWCGKAATAIH